MLNTVWNRVSAACFNSLTIAVNYLAGLFGTAMTRIDDLAALVGDQSFSQNVQSIIGTDPKVLGKWLAIASAVTIASRLRSIVKKPVAPAS